MQNDRKKYTSKEKTNSNNSDSTSSDEYKVVRKSGASDRTDAKPRSPRPPRRDDSGSDFKPRGPRRDDSSSDFKPRGEKRTSTDSKFTPRGPKRDDRDSKPRSSSRRDEGGSDFKPRGPRRDDSSSDSRFSPRGPKRDDRGSSRRDEGGSDFKPRGPRRDDTSSDSRFSPRGPKRDDRGSSRRDEGGSDFKPRGPRRDDTSSDSKFSPRGPKRDDRAPRRDDSNSTFSPRGPKRDHRDRYDDDSTEFKHDTLTSQDGTWRLNKYIANSGVCGRREADQLISDGKVTVNGKVVTELGTKVNNKDTVKVDGAEISPEDFTYLLLNKLKNYITTMDDEKGRSTVMDLVADATGLRVYPVGRLDRNTTGLLLMTNDGDLANRLMHPSYKVKKTYIVETSIPLTDPQILEMRQGIMLDDGMAQAHEARRVPGSPNALKISIFEGRNRQIRRMIEYFKVEVIKLHRTYYAGLTVQDIRPGRWRFLKSDEVNNLRMLVKLFDLKQK